MHENNVYELITGPFTSFVDYLDKKDVASWRLVCKDACSSIDKALNELQCTSMVKDTELQSFLDKTGTSLRKIHISSLKWTGVPISTLFPVHLMNELNDITLKYEILMDQGNDQDEFPVTIKETSCELKSFRNLEKLTISLPPNISGNILTQNLYFPKLAELSSNHISWDTLRCCMPIENMRKLTMMNCGAIDLSVCCNLCNLQHLEIHACILEYGLSKSTALPELTTLIVANTDANNQCIRSSMPNLKRVTLCNVSNMWSLDSFLPNLGQDLDYVRISSCESLLNISSLQDKIKGDGTMVIEFCKNDMIFPQTLRGAYIKFYGSVIFLEDLKYELKRCAGLYLSNTCKIITDDGKLHIPKNIEDGEKGKYYSSMQELNADYQ